MLLIGVISISNQYKDCEEDDARTYSLLISGHIETILRFEINLSSILNHKKQWELNTIPF